MTVSAKTRLWIELSRMQKMAHAAHANRGKSHIRKTLGDISDSLADILYSEYFENKDEGKNGNHE